ncbi:MAG: hypothetical protein R3224_09810, partial [Balneolaceae bacterium]|nr:hypothetical protein [Balneolaceae bacterium]
MKTIFTAVTLLFILAGYLIAQPLPEIASETITADKAERIITRLSSDAMRGRRAFTPGIARASRFISDEFERIGLEYLDGADSYRQEFMLYLLNPRQAEAVLNGESVSGADRFYLSRRDSVSWPDLSVVPQRRITKSDNFGQAFSNIRQSGEDMLVLVDTAHEPDFHRYAAYFGRVNRTFTVNEGP